MASSELHKSAPRGITDRVSCRQVLNFMVILGFMFNYMLRVNLTIAIVAMVRDPISIPPPIPTTNLTLNFNSSDLASLNQSSDALFKAVERDTSEDWKFTWDKYEQNLLLGCFFWGYVLTELPGGRLAEVVGAKRVFGGGMLTASLATIITPWITLLGFNWLVALRILVGFCLGATWPAIPPMASKWIPPLERSKFIANMMASSLGAAITMPVCGFLIANVGWESVFYITGGIGTFWSILWFVLIHDTPADHPRISPEEKHLIETAIAEGAGKGVKPSRVPWKAMLLSMPVWAIIITHGCSVFGYFTVVNQLPTYMKEVLHFNIKANGLFSSLPYLAKYAMAVLASTLADHLRRSGRLSTTATRKLFTSFAVFIPALLMVAEALWGINATLSITIFTCSLFFNGAVTAGYLANGLDIAPNFSGTIFGLANTLSSLGGYLSTYMVAELTHESQTFEQWKWVFWILVVVYTVGATTFLVFGTGNLQPWNSVARTDNGLNGAEELKPLKTADKDREIAA